MLNEKLNIEQLAEEIAEFLSNYMKVDQLILFGSYCHNNFREDSDIDIAVISEDLDKMNILERIKILSQTPIKIDSRIELKGYGRNEFLHPEPASMLALIKKEGRIIYS